MKIHLILSKAAKAIHDGHPKCILSAMLMVATQMTRHYGMYHETAMVHDAYQFFKDLYQFPDINSFGPVTEESTQHRVTALLLASHIAKDKFRRRK